MRRRWSTGFALVLFLGAGGMGGAEWAGAVAGWGGEAESGAAEGGAVAPSSLPPAPGALEVPDDVLAARTDPEAAAAFLARMVGRWTVRAEAVMAPGASPVETNRSESARLLGGRWLVAEATGTTPTGAPVESLLTLGYDGVQEEIVGSWVDSMQGTLWRYRGTLEAGGDLLVLETEGPVLGNPEVITRYREVIEFEGPELRVTRSSILGPDGAWFEYGRAEYHLEAGGT